MSAFHEKLTAGSLHSSDPVRSKRVFEAMLKMKKLDIDELCRVYDKGELVPVRLWEYAVRA